MGLHIRLLTKVWPHSFTTIFLPPGSSTVTPSMTADSNITVIPHSTRTTSATVSSPVTDFTRSAVHPSCPTANSADDRGIDEDKVERLVWEYFNRQMAASKSEKVSDGASRTQQTLEEGDGLVSQTLPLIDWSYTETQ